MLDLGTGSGVLAIALARLLPQARITASDVDPVAAGVACANVRLNGVGTQVGVTVADGLPRARPSRAGRHDLIVANILAGPLARLAPRVTGALRPGGLLVLSGILVPQAAGVVARYGGLGARLIRHDRIAGWSTLTLVQTRQRPAPGAGAGRWGSCGRWRLRRSGGRRPKPVSRRGG
jgi:ribosomal protein L11 methyltransferase